MIGGSPPPTGPRAQDPLRLRPPRRRSRRRLRSIEAPREAPGCPCWFAASRTRARTVGPAYVRVVSRRSRPSSGCGRTDTRSGSTPKSLVSSLLEHVVEDDEMARTVVPIQHAKQSRLDSVGHRPVRTNVVHGAHERETTAEAAQVEPIRLWTQHLDVADVEMTHEEGGDARVTDRGPGRATRAAPPDVPVPLWRLDPEGRGRPRTRATAPNDLPRRLGRAWTVRRSPARSALSNSGFASACG